MDIYKIARQREEEMARFYSDLAKNSTNPSLAKVFDILSFEESRHVEFVDALQEHKKLDIVEEVSYGAKDVLNELKLRRDLFAKIPDSQVELYKKARDYEQESVNLYKKFYAEVHSADMQGLLQEMIDEEQRHFEVLDEIVQMVSRPDYWVEDAEFGVRQEY